MKKLFLTSPLLLLLFFFGCDDEPTKVVKINPEDTLFHLTYSVEGTTKTATIIYINPIDSSEVDLLHQNLPWDTTINNISRGRPYCLIVQGGINDTGYYDVGVYWDRNDGEYFGTSGVGCKINNPNSYIQFYGRVAEISYPPIEHH